LEHVSYTRNEKHKNGGGGGGGGGVANLMQQHPCLDCFASSPLLAAQVTADFLGSHESSLEAYKSSANVAFACVKRTTMEQETSMCEEPNRLLCEKGYMKG